MGRNTPLWIVTGLFCAVVGFSGFAHCRHREQRVEATGHLGNPLCFMTIIGLAKLAGVIAVLAPERPLLKDWARGFFAGASGGLGESPAVFLVDRVRILGAGQPCWVQLWMVF